MYAESDFLLALVKDEDWGSERAESVYRDHEDDLWTSRATLVELLLVAYREDLNAKRVVGSAADLLAIRGDEDAVLAAAVYVSDHNFTPFDALHLVESGGDTIVSSDDTYDGFAPRLDLRE
ncbi:MAG: PIN domain-containing protein [Halorientalis sp.]